MGLDKSVYHKIEKEKIVLRDYQKECIEKILKYKITPDDETFYCIDGNSSYMSDEKYEKIINLLVIHGLARCLI